MFAAIKQSIKNVGPVYRAINRAKGVRIHEPETKRAMARIGSDYGGWGIDLSLVDKGSVVYAVGVGEDISFDLGLIDAAGCAVDAFDPTPIAVNWVAGQQLPTKFRFHALGLGGEDGEVEFQIPPIDGWHSYSLTAASDAEQSGTVACPIRRLATIMQQFGHTRVDVLKMDIEGFEYRVIDDIIASAIRPRQLLIEFHHLLYAHTSEETIAAVQRLRDYGYRISWVSDGGREYAFVDARN